MTLSSTKPTQEGYSFQGWATSRRGAAAYFAGNDVQITGGNVTLYAAWLTPDLVLPASLTVIEAEAFYGDAFTYVLVPACVEAIGSGAFAHCPSLQSVEIQGSDTLISDNAFGGRTDFTIIAPAGSAAETWAIQHNVNFQPAA